MSKLTPTQHRPAAKTTASLSYLAYDPYTLAMCPTVDKYTSRG